MTFCNTRVNYSPFGTSSTTQCYGPDHSTTTYYQRREPSQPSPSSWRANSCSRSVFTAPNFCPPSSNSPFYSSVYANPSRTYHHSQSNGVGAVLGALIAAIGVAAIMTTPTLPVYYTRDPWYPVGYYGYYY